MTCYWDARYTYMYLRCWSLSRSENYKTEMHSNKVSACKVRLHLRYHEMLLRCEMILRHEIVLRCKIYRIISFEVLRFSLRFEQIEVVLRCEIVQDFPPPPILYSSLSSYMVVPKLWFSSLRCYIPLYRVQTYRDLKVLPEEEPV